MEEIKEVVLDYIKVEDKIAKNGKPYTALSVKIRGEEDFRGGFCKRTDAIASLSNGDTALLKLYEEEWNGKMYKKVAIPSQVDLLSAKVDILTKRVEELESKAAPTVDISQVDIDGPNF